MEFFAEQAQNYMKISFKGTTMLSNQTQELTEIITRIKEENIAPKLLIDLSNCKKMNSIGVSMLVKIWNLEKAGIKVALVVSDPNILEILKNTRIAEVMKGRIFPTIEEADTFLSK